MNFTEKQKESFKSVTLPLIDWLKENAHPHCKVVVDQTYAELSEGRISIVDTLSIKDTPCIKCSGNFHYQDINEDELCIDCAKDNQ